MAAVCLLHSNVELPDMEALHMSDRGKPPLMLDHVQDSHSCLKVGGFNWAVCCGVVWLFVVCA